jgi:membrane protein DedA with SNARE-associated domain
MPVGRFLALTALGTVGWNALLLGTGALLGDRWRQVTGVVDGLSTLTLAVLAVAALIACALLVRRRLAAR